MKITFVVACREERRAEAHCAALTQVAGDRVAGRATVLDDVTRICAEQRPDVVLLEHVPVEEANLWSILRRLALASPASRLIVLCDLCTDRLVSSFISNGVCGSVSTRCDASLLAKAVDAVHRGEHWFARTAVLQALRRQLAARAIEQPVTAVEERLLTAREREILALIGAGMSNKEIGRALQISDQTVKTHLHHVYVKLQRSGRYKAFAATPASASGGFRAFGARPTPS